MLNIDFENLNLTLDLFKANSEHLQQMAVEFMTELGYERHEVILICAAYTDFWKEFIDGFNPEVEKEAYKLGALGQQPTSLSATTNQGLTEYLSEVYADIELPKEPPVEGKVWSLFLHEKGHGWLQIPLSGTHF